MIEVLFWSSFLLLAWTYVLYPAAVLALARIAGRPVRREDPAGRVSLIVAAHNEEAVIDEKVRNSLALDFGKADGEVIIISDGSSDRTNEILRGFQGTSDRLQVLFGEERRGKASALNRGVAGAKGDILVFSDANVFVEPGALRELVAPFADPAVGCACGHIRVRGKGEEIAGEGVYMRLESVVQKAESAVWSTVGVDGAFFALRRRLFRDLDPGTILDDFALSMEAPIAGQRIVYADGARGVEEVVASAALEFRRKTRIVAGGFQYLARRWRDLLRMRPVFLGMLVSHKLLRWLSPILLIGLVATNGVLAGRPFYAALLAAQALFYASAAAAGIIPALRMRRLFYIPYYFCVINASALVGLGRFVRGKQGVLWKKAQRS